jgi:hypothetical protein
VEYRAEKLTGQPGIENTERHLTWVMSAVPHIGCSIVGVKQNLLLCFEHFENISCMTDKNTIFL